MILEPHQVVAVAPAVLLAQLHNRVRPAPCARVVKPRRLHRPKPQGLPASPRQLFHRQTSLKERRIRVVLGNVEWHALPSEQRVHKPLVLFLVQRAVEVIVGAVNGFAPPRRRKRDLCVDRFSVHNRAYRIVEEQPPRARPAPNIRRQRIRGERPTGHNHNPVLGNRLHFPPYNFNPRMSAHPLGHHPRKLHPVHGQSVSRGYARLFGNFEQQRVPPPQLFLQQPRRRILALALQRVAAYQLGHFRRLVCRGRTLRPHLAQPHFVATLRQLPGRFRPRQPRANHRNFPAASRCNSHSFNSTG